MSIKETSPNKLNVKVLMISIGKNRQDFTGNNKRIHVLLVLLIGMLAIVTNF